MAIIRHLDLGHINSSLKSPTDSQSSVRKCHFDSRKILGIFISTQKLATAERFVPIAFSAQNTYICQKESSNSDICRKSAQLFFPCDPFPIGRFDGDSSVPESCPARHQKMT